MSDDFEKRAREAALAHGDDIYTMSFIAGAYWARTEMQAEIDEQVKEPREWILDGDDGTSHALHVGKERFEDVAEPYDIHVIEKSAYDALKAELARYKSDYVVGNLSAARMENARLTEELAVANACALANVRDVPIAQELEQTKDYNKFLSEQLAANASSRSYFENECRKLEHELAAAKHRIETWHKPDQLLLEKERDEARGELIAAKGEIKQLTRERAKVSSKGNIAYLWFAGKDGWQVTSFHPKDEPAIGFKESKMYVNYDAFAELDAELEQAKGEIERLHSALDGYVKEDGSGLVQKLQRQLKSHETGQQMAQLRVNNIDLKKELAAAKGEINRLTEKCETLFMKGQEVVSELAAAKGEIVNLKRQNESIEESATLVVTERDELKAELERAKGEIERLTNGK